MFFPRADSVLLLRWGRRRGSTVGLAICGTLPGATVIRWRRRRPGRPTRIVPLSLPLLALPLPLALGPALTLLARRPSGRRSQQLRDGQIILAVLLQRFEGLRRVINFTGLDDPVMIGIQRLDYRREPVMSMSARSTRRRPHLRLSIASALRGSRPIVFRRRRSGRRPILITSLSTLSNHRRWSIHGRRPTLQS